MTHVKDHAEKSTAREDGKKSEGLKSSNLNLLPQKDLLEAIGRTERGSWRRYESQTDRFSQGSVLASIFAVALPQKTQFDCTDKCSRNQ